MNGLANCGCGVATQDPKSLGRSSPFSPEVAHSGQDALASALGGGPAFQILSLRTCHLPFGLDSYVVTGPCFEDHGNTVQLSLPPTYPLLEQAERAIVPLPVRSGPSSEGWTGDHHRPPLHFAPRHRAPARAGPADSHSPEDRLNWVVPVVRSVCGTHSSVFRRAADGNRTRAARISD